jgi:serine/threonine-protein kinase
MKTCPVCDVDFPDQHTTCPKDGAMLIVSHELAEGSLVRGKYRIQSKLGQGGMGVVYLAEHLLLGGHVALKFLAGDLGKDPKFIKRFRMEARAAHQLRHPNIVEVIDLDQSEDGSLFIAMEYVQGPSLRAVLDEARGGLEVTRALEIVRGIAAGLAAAHAHGTVHRDIKPENILLVPTADGKERAKVLDFGIAAMADSSTRVSRTHGFLLTPDYAAPEQWLEMPADQMDGRTDLYALGCVFYEMLTGQTPFHAHNTSGWMKQHLEETPRRPSDLRSELTDWPGLDGLVMRLLAKNRDDRPQDAGLLSLLNGLQYEPGAEPTAMITAEMEAWRPTETVIERAWEPHGTVATPLPPPVQPIPPAVKPDKQKIPVWAWAAFAIPALGAVVAGVLLYAPHKHQPQPEAMTPPPLTAAAPRIDTHEHESTSAKEQRSFSAMDGEPVTGKAPVESVVQKPTPKEIVKPQPSFSEIEQQALSLYGQRRYTEASALLEKVCTGGSWESCKDLGNMYSGGNGVDRDDVRAADFFSKSCDAAPPKGCNSLGVQYHNGQGVAQDDSRAAALYKKACDAGDAMGCSNLGNSYSSGRGVAKDYARAAAFYQKACDAGNAVSCSNLGVYYRLGVGVAKNPDVARQMLDKACNLGNQKSCELKNQMK